LVLPLGEFDDDLLSPLIEWIKVKMKRKLDKFKSENRSKSSENKKEQSPSKKRKSISYTKDKIIENNSSSTHHHHSHSHHSQHETSVAGDDVESSSSSDEEFDPFKRTGHVFGSLINEIKYRYSKYFSDFKDALNIHCLIAFVFIFTVCIVPALSFGGILGEQTSQL
jgi:hypothetical protein